MIVADVLQAAGVQPVPDLGPLAQCSDHVHVLLCLPSMDI